LDARAPDARPETRVEADDVPEWKIREVRMTCLSVTALGK
jgi:hypothetical protein